MLCHLSVLLSILLLLAENVPEFVRANPETYKFRRCI
jgi:hypothetical protein